MIPGADKTTREAAGRALGAEEGAAVAGLGTVVARLALTGLWTGLLLTLWLVGAACLRGGRRLALRRRTMRSWGRCGLWALNVRVEVQGTPPTSAGLVVSNHVSYVDILVYSAVLGASFVSMVEIRSWPVVGPLSRLVGTVFIDRSRKRELVAVNEHIEHVLGEGRQLVVFPEGTNTDGSRVHPFRPSLLQPAARGALPVHYAAVTYRSHPADPPAAVRVAWFGGAPFLPHVLSLMRGRPVQAIVRFGPVAVRSHDRKQLADDLHGAVSGLFSPLQ